MTKDFKFEIEKVYQQEAEKLLHCRKQSKVIHASGDINASGDEVEKPVRDMISRRLPAKYYVGHGHIVDKDLRVSPQIDLVVADNSATPILLEGQNGIQYFPYESVYLIGEVKSTYVASRKYVTAFSKTLEKVKGELRRDPTPRNYIGHGITLGNGLTTGRKEDFRNPLFSFMLFVDSGDLTPKRLLLEYAELPDLFLPNIICFLDGRVVLKAELNPEGGNYKLGGIDMNCHAIVSRDDIYWLLVDFKHDEHKSGQALATLMLGISSHLRECLLLDPRLQQYLNHILKNAAHFPSMVDIKGIDIFPASKPEGVDFGAEFRETLGRKRELDSAYDAKTGKKRNI